ncbi:MAG: peptidase domain-containing ABC transporter [Opitutaceae bacterium]|nr:peptidase domain-containing ABC transporter [Opitutaceae bacterium]
MKQRDQSDCGPTCLAYLCRRYRRPQAVAQLRQWSGTGRSGTTALGLVQAGEKAGLSVAGVRTSPADLGNLPLPVVAHVVLPSHLHHYVVLEKVNGRNVRVMDPAVGSSCRWPREKLTGMSSGVFLLVSPKPGEIVKGDPGAAAESPWSRLARLLHPHRSLLLQAGLGAALATVLGLAMSLYVEKLLDSVLPDQDSRMLVLLGAGMLGVIAARVVLTWLQGRIGLRLAQRIDAVLMLGYYRHLLRLPRAFHDGMRVGEMLSRVGDAARIRTFINQTLVSLLLNPLIVAASLTGLFFYDWRLGALAGGLIVLQGMMYPVANVVNRRAQRLLMVRAAEWQGHLAESLQTHLTVRAMNLEDREAERGEQQLVRLLRAHRGAVTAGLWLGVFNQASTQLYTLGTLWIGGWLVLQQHLSMGELMSAYTLAGYLVGPASSLVSLNSSVQEAMVATDRLFEIVDLQPEPTGGVRMLNPETMGDIEWESVTVQHPGRLPVLREFSAVFRRGTLTVLVGASGCGKSTILAVLQASQDITQGRVSIGGVGLEHFSLDGLRRGLAVMPQRVELFSGSVMDNLIPDGGPPDVARLLEACRDANVLGWIESLPDKFGTWLQEGGANLSGGQRQRLALARAFYRSGPLLLLDEPTSALEDESEQHVVAAIRRRVGAGITAIVACHRQAFCHCADQIIRL